MSGKGGARQRHVAGASASASENSEVSTSTVPSKPSKPSKPAKASAEASAAASDSSAAAATVEREARPEDTQRALRFIIMLSIAILVVPIATFFGVQAAFGVGKPAVRLPCLLLTARGAQATSSRRLRPSLLSIS